MNKERMDADMHINDPCDLIFFDAQQLRPRHLRMYNNLTLELSGGRIERVMGMAPSDTAGYEKLIGKILF